MDFKKHGKPAVVGLTDLAVVSITTHLGPTCLDELMQPGGEHSGCWCEVMQLPGSLSNQPCSCTAGFTDVTIPICFADLFFMGGTLESSSQSLIRN